VAGLQQSGERPWLELSKEVTEAWLAQRLRPYGIKSRTIRIGAEVSRGYLQEDMKETFMRYIPKSEVEALRAELAEPAVKESEAQVNGEIKAERALPAPGQADTGEGAAAATGHGGG
jgi:hypothetical protein